MFIMDLPAIPPHDTPVVLVQAADTSLQLDYTLKTCDEVSSGGEGIVDPAAWLVDTVLTKNGRQVSAQEAEALTATVKFTQLQGVAHGRLISRSPSGRIFYAYRPDPGYVGKDQAIFMAEFKGKRYRIEANVVVSRHLNDNDPQCPEPKLIEVIKHSSGASGYGSGYKLASFSISYQPNPSFEQDAAEARRPSTLR